MPPTFLLFVGFLVYLLLTVLTAGIIFPILSVLQKRLLAKKFLATVLISFPCLIIMGVLLAIIFVIPGILFYWLANAGYIPQPVGIIIAIIATLTFTGAVASSSLYLWYFLSKIIYRRLEKKSFADILENDKVFNFLRKPLSTLNLYPRNKLHKTNSGLY